MSNYRTSELETKLNTETQDSFAIFYGKKAVSLNKVRNNPQVPESIVYSRFSNKDGHQILKQLDKTEKKSKVILNSSLGEDHIALLQRFDAEFNATVDKQKTLRNQNSKPQKEFIEQIIAESTIKSVNSNPTSTTIHPTGSSHNSLESEDSFPEGILASDSPANSSPNSAAAAQRTATPVEEEVVAKQSSSDFSAAAPQAVASEEPDAKSQSSSSNTEFEHKDDRSNTRPPLTTERSSSTLSDASAKSGSSASKQKSPWGTLKHLVRSGLGIPKSDNKKSIDLSDVGSNQDHEVLGHDEANQTTLPLSPIAESSLQSSPNSERFIYDSDALPDDPNVELAAASTEQEEPRHQENANVEAPLPLLTVEDTEEPEAALGEQEATSAKQEESRVQEKANEEEDAAATDLENKAENTHLIPDTATVVKPVPVKFKPIAEDVDYDYDYHNDATRSAFSASAGASSMNQLASAEEPLLNNGPTYYVPLNDGSKGCLNPISNQKDFVESHHLNVALNHRAPVRTPFEANCSYAMSAATSYYVCAGFVVLGVVALLLLQFGPDAFTVISDLNLSAGFITQASIAAVSVVGAGLTVAGTRQMFFSAKTPEDVYIVGLDDLTTNNNV